MRYLDIFCITATLLFLISCSNLPPSERLLEPQEVALDTDGGTTMLFHSALYYPAEISLNFPGFILGIEKSPVKIITTPGDIHIQEVDASGFSREELHDEVVDKKILYVSHILENFSDPYGLANCVHYNAYYRQTQQDSPVAFCDSATPVEVQPEKAYVGSWLAMAKLKQLIENRIENYTHVIVITMGWNTVQEEAVRNFNSIVKNMKKAAGDNPFNPLVIGVTWPSQWASKWLEPLVRSVSFPWKAHDADEVGLTWLGVLLHNTLADISKPIVIIGHSFGARASSVAACIGPVITEKPEKSALQRDKFDHLINLQGAYRTNRLLGQHRSGKLKYGGNCSEKVSQITLTSSQSDTAMDTLFWRKDKYAGDDESFARQCEKGNETVKCGYATSKGEINRFHGKNSHVTYINGDELITKNAYLSGGDAHSDIYRAEHGVLLWNIINQE